MLSEKWTRFRVGSGILKRRRSGGLRVPSPNNQQQRRQHQLHKQIPRKVKQNPHLPRSNARTQAADEEGGVPGAVEEGEVKAEANLSLLEMLDYLIYWRFIITVMSTTLQFWKPGTLGPGSSLDRTSGEDDAFIPSAAPSQRDRLPIAKHS